MSKNRESSNNYKKELKGLMPDEDDRKNIAEFIKLYDAKFPYPHPESIGRCLEESLEEIEHNPSNNGIIRRMSLPQKFHLGLSQAYPDLFTDQAKTEWFLKNFPTFDLTK